MKIGDKNDEVKELQERLIADGYMTGPSTGYFWVKTLAAVRKFQKDHGIRTVNGVVYTTGNVGPLTLAALNK
jgi:N-acetylmuramoyl-L-alanine amidase